MLKFFQNQKENNFTKIVNLLKIKNFINFLKFMNNSFKDLQKHNFIILISNQFEITKNFEIVKKKT